MNVLEVIDRDQWNQIVFSFPEYHLHQGYEWGEIRREGGWLPYRYAVLDGDRPGAIFLRISPGVSNTESAVREALVEHDFRHLPNDWTWWNAPRIIVTM